MHKCQRDSVMAREAIVSVDLKSLDRKYDMSTLLIVAETNKSIEFENPGQVTIWQIIGKCH